MKTSAYVRVLGSNLAAALCLAALGAGGCATSVRLTTLEPASVNLGPTNRLAILQGEGRRSAREAVFQDLIASARTQGYFQASDRSEEGIRVKVAGRKVSVEGDSKGPQENEAYLRVDVLGWDARRDSKEKETTDKDGKKKTVSTVTTTGKALLAVTLFDREGRALLAEKEYEGKFETEDKDMSEEAVIKSAGQKAVAQLLADITPKQVQRSVRLDDSDDAQKNFLKTAEGGNIAQARTDIEKYFGSNPNNSAAAYNLAVLTEAKGDYEGALALYDKALKLGTKDFYGSARADCAKRKADAEALLKGN
jgi:tetratricopeptide (TPR) repeat protein